MNTTEHRCSYVVSKIRLPLAHKDMVIAHARYIVFQMAEVAVPRDLFRRILGLIDQLPPRPVARC